MKKIKDELEKQHQTQTHQTPKPRVKRKPPVIGEGTITGYVIGRGKKVIDPNQVRKLAALGCKDTEICRFFDIGEDVMRYNFNDELIMGREEMKISLRTAMLENACVKMNPALQIFLAKNYLGMKDVPTDSEDTKPLPWDDNF